MKCGLLPVSHNALLVGDMAYYDFNGEMEQEADRINLQKCLGPTCKVCFGGWEAGAECCGMVLSNAAFTGLGETAQRIKSLLYRASVPSLVPT